jgi:hypothetical protein
MDVRVITLRYEEGMQGFPEGQSMHSTAIGCSREQSTAIDQEQTQTGGCNLDDTALQRVRRIPPPGRLRDGEHRAVGDAFVLPEVPDPPQRRRVALVQRRHEFPLVRQDGGWPMGIMAIIVTPESASRDDRELLSHPRVTQVMRFSRCRPASQSAAPTSPAAFAGRGSP